MTRRRFVAAGLALATTSYFCPWPPAAVVLGVAAVIVLVCAITEPPEPPRPSATADDVYARARRLHPSSSCPADDWPEGENA